jgi:uncharacterized membrane protein
METKQKKSFLTTAPSWLLALLILIVAAIVLTISDSIITPHSETGLISHIINDMIIAAGCFFIVRKNPKSIWYVPLICNALLIVSSIVEPNFWGSRMCIPICGGWALSLIASFIAANKGKQMKI